jgi:hypothetical protein
MRVPDWLDPLVRQWFMAARKLVDWVKCTLGDHDLRRHLQLNRQDGAKS